MVSNLVGRQVVHDGPFERCSALKLIENAFGLLPLAARDANALDLAAVLHSGPRPHVPEDAIPTSSQVPGAATGAAAACSAASVQSVSPPPARSGYAPGSSLPSARSGWPTGSGMSALGGQYRKDLDG